MLSTLPRSRHTKIILFTSSSLCSAVRISLQFHIFLDIRTLKHELIVEPLILKEV